MKHVDKTGSWDQRSRTTWWSATGLYFGYGVEDEVADSAGPWRPGGLSEIQNQKPGLFGRWILVLSPCSGDIFDLAH
ncbi:unnamed protein product [Gongylonema pulchrum]|uniref:Uncharacterized protein n=1 Tax=Gongylonema pulchrum TaxID=637853 RepID=A0A183E6K8_9BILA|nr:unnamed protein product [Gongylonema pulchrum]